MKKLLSRLLLLITTILFATHTPIQVDEGVIQPHSEPDIVSYSDDNQVLELDYQEPSRGVERELPNVDGAFKTYMDYRTITNQTSTQWYLQQGAWTNTNGVRMYGDRCLVAMGTYYTEQCGDKFNITLDNGQVIMVIVGDIKQPQHTDDSNMYVEENGNIIEFIVDVNLLNGMTLSMGDMSFSGYKGSIVSIVKVT